MPALVILIAAVAAAVAMVVSLLSAAAEGVGEGWTSPLLYLTDVAIGFGGLFAFAMLCNAVLRIAVVRTSPPMPDGVGRCGPCC